MTGKTAFCMVAVTVTVVQHLSEPRYLPGLFRFRFHHTHGSELGKVYLREEVIDKASNTSSYLLRLSGRLLTARRVRHRRKRKS